ncbi:MAG TPA: 4-hydroxy-3-methylbut-2-en-1-yl diphosphate synthase, partial [Succinivibrionaceae bacterium]|nr:4-hydroxy-3-methylbut-2-en-1-yl diphosphate synthase [Succinivibrionaceae bacterium]
METSTKQEIVRRKSRRINVGGVYVGGDSPISVQSMTSTDTLDVESTLSQIRALADAGADIVRVSVPSLDAVEAFEKITRDSPVPIVSDIHFDYRIALRCAELGFDKIRINPGNIG